MKKYYFICYSVSNGVGKPSSDLYNEAIDYSPLKWIIRENSTTIYKRYVLVSYQEITKEEYTSTKEFLDKNY